MHKFVFAQYAGYADNIVPNGRRFEFTKVCSRIKHVRMLLKAVFPQMQQGFHGSKGSL